MTIKKHSWFKYGSQSFERAAELRIKNYDGKIIDKAIWDLKDKDSERKIFTIFKHRYGLFKKSENDLDIIKEQSESN